ncbi:protein kinase domain-containing protein [Cyanobacterium aponinum]|uniref:non-specific serine/threonine protein kinase n=1 Tax=Cyanobacterium aponinum 0216 TaxID=2676140 RepID=A0A844GR43_9CHRO|nr:protein kinase [Cyanobacterium aponinum]MTF37522.1 protein kinase [Cyanobacterium aponinum 0216]
MFKLNEIKDYPLAKIREISKQLNTADENPEYKLDCTDVYGLDDDVLEALFSAIRDDWKQEVNGYYRELDNFIININGDLLEDLKAYLTNLNKEQYSSNFNFLSTPDLLKIATQAESHYQKHPETSIILCRQFIELLAKYVSAKRKIYDEIKNEKLIYIINTLRNKNAIGHRAYNLLNDVRNMANQVIHPEPEHATNIDSNRPNITSKTALKFIKKIHELAIWYHKAYCRNPKIPFEPPIYDPNKIIKRPDGNIDSIAVDKELTIIEGGNKTYNSSDIEGAESGTKIVSSIDDYEANSQTTELLPTGSLIRQRYRIEKKLSSGSFGTTYLAEDLGKPTKPFCVVKQFTPKKTDRGTFSRAVELFKKEAEVLENLGSHPEIPTMIEYFEEGDNLLLIQDYIEGNTLREEFREDDKPYQQDEVIQLLKDILNPLCYVHQKKIVHRDLKPENLIRRVNDNKIVIIDFGAVKEIFENKQEKGTCIGTVGYMPIEQSRGDTLSFKFDVYALGMIAIEALTNQPARNISSPKNTIKQIGNISNGFRDILLKMTASDSDYRYDDAQAVLKAITQLKPSKPEGESVPLWLKITIGVGILAIVALFIKSLPYFNKTKLQQKELTIGTIWKPEASQGLADYIEENSVPANYFDFLKGDEIKVRINGDRTLSYPEAKKRMEAKQWDIAFATSPMLSIFAKNQGYNHLAGMFPGSNSYNAGLFVRSDSPIQSINDINSSTKVALGSFTSASSFYMPVYNLYGKTIVADVGNRGEAIIEKVKNGDADVGSAAIGDSVRKDDPTLRIIHVSRDIPGSGVYASPNLSKNDYENVKKLMLNAPSEIQKEANYEAKPEPDYTEFKKIVQRVEEILICADFTKNPVTLACTGEIQTIEGNINGVSLEGNNSVLKISADGQIYNISIPVKMTIEIFGSDKLTDIQGKSVIVKTNKLNGNKGQISNSQQIEVYE